MKFINITWNQPDWTWLFHAGIIVLCTRSDTVFDSSFSSFIRFKIKVDMQLWAFFLWKSLLIMVILFLMLAAWLLSSVLHQSKPMISDCNLARNKNFQKAPGTNCIVKLVIHITLGLATIWPISPLTELLQNKKIPYCWTFYFGQNFFYLLICWTRIGLCMPRYSTSQLWKLGNWWSHWWSLGKASKPQSWHGTLIYSRFPGPWGY